MHRLDIRDTPKNSLGRLSGSMSNPEDIRYFWAKTLGVSGPQWLILMALADLPRAEDTRVDVVARMLDVDPSFVTTRSKMLEKKGFVRRTISEVDAQVVQISLTDKSYEHLAKLASSGKS
jgi:DNA-binding MarR family transcriptional regulator